MKKGPLGPANVRDAKSFFPFVGVVIEVMCIAVGPVLWSHDQSSYMSIERGTAKVLKVVLIIGMPVERDEFAKNLGV